MGMYDTINGEQVKCFSWMSYGKDGLWEHGGDLKYYGIGDEVPYKKPHYNYGKNFIILDLNRFPDSEYSEYDYIIHVIKDGKVAAMYENEIGEIDWDNNESVVSYNGDLLNIKSSDCIKNYITAQRKYWEDSEKVREKWNELFGQSMKYFTGLGLLDKDSDERKERVKKIEEIHILMDKEKERIKPEEDKLANEMSKWFIRDYDNLIILGQYLDSYYCALRLDKQEEVGMCNEMISKILKSDETICDRYLEWQEVDDLDGDFQ